MIEEVRQFLSSWALAITAILGLIITWKQAKPTVMNWFRTLNLFHRMDIAEEEIDELQKEVNADAGD